jgi:type IV pilus assembly protein PilM
MMLGIEKRINWKKMKSQNDHPIGLDIGHDFIKMIQLSGEGGRMSVLAADKIRIERDICDDDQKRRNFIVSAIRQKLESGNYSGKNVVSCLPKDALKITSIRLPELRQDKVEQTLKEEAAQRFGLDAEKDSINYVVAGSVCQGDDTRDEYILFVAENEVIRNHIEMLEEGGFRPLSIDIVPYALFRVFERFLKRREDKDRTAVLVDVGSRKTTIMFVRGEDISFVKQIPIGGEDFNEEVAVKLGISVSEAEVLRKTLRAQRLPAVPVGAGQDELEWALGEGADLSKQGLDESTRRVMVDAISCVSEKLAREISLCFRYYTVTFRGRRVERVVFAGGGAYENILFNVLRRQLAVEVEIAEPLKGFDIMNVKFDSDKRGFLCEWAVAVGLALK